MFISRECDYAIRVVRALADGEKKTADEICRQENISNQFAYKIMKKLEKKKLLRVYRGVHGGYALTMSVDDLCLYDVFVAMEDHVVLTACLTGNFDCPMNRGDKPCSVHQEFERIQQVLTFAMKEKTLREILAE
ncbi:MAG: Rrf2 family transcriptional regulator [Clostridiales Family XIII bacterium]|jgi:Rrf2 family protein|nr:Rrf2 family transcriptional regulator [Clostridiales Family XIII bacterium]